MKANIERNPTKLLLILLFVGGTYLALLCTGLWFTYKHNQEQTMVVSVDETQQMLEEASQCYSLYLQDVGYSKQWADHKANVETGLSPVDSLYYAIDQD